VSGFAMNGTTKMSKWHALARVHYPSWAIHSKQICKEVEGEMQVDRVPQRATCPSGMVVASLGESKR